MKNTTERLLNFLHSNMKNDGLDDGALQSAVRDVLTDIMHICVDNGFDIKDVLSSSQEVFEEEVEKCGAFCHDDHGDGLTICEEVSGTEHSHHDDNHQCRKATAEEEKECLELWKANEEAVVHLKDGKVVDITKE